MLDNDSLLQIFSYYRLKHEDNWNIRFMWRNLIHVSRRWRYLIFDWRSHLDICLLLTHDSPSLYTLSHLPPLPLVIDYSDRTRTITRKDDDNIHLGLQQHGHVHQVSLRAPASGLCMLLEPMDKDFPRLENLSLLSTTIEEVNPMLLETFQAPNLRCLTLHGVGLPKGLPLLSSAMALSTLILTHIGAYCYFPPRDLVTQIQGLPQLEELSIGFAIPIPLPSSQQELLSPPIPPVSLPSLRQLTFWGVDIYLDNFVAQINTPLLERLSLTLRFDLTFSLVNLTEFIRRTEGFRSLVASVIFKKGGPSIDAGHHEQGGLGKLNLHVNCEPLDWQIDSATQVCSALANVVSAVEALTLDLDVDGMASDWADTLDSLFWHELLLPFIGVKKLHIGSSLTVELSQALRSAAGGLALELLPDLQELHIAHSRNLHVQEIDHAKDALFTFVEIRESVGRHVHLSTPSSWAAKPEVTPKTPRTVVQVPRSAVQVPRAAVQVHHIDLTAVDYVNRPYRNQTIKLIGLCRTCILTQRQTLRSYEELRR